MDRRTFLDDQLSDVDTLVPKPVAVGTWYEVCFVFYFTVFQLIRFFLF